MVDARYVLVMVASLALAACSSTPSPVSTTPDSGVDASDDLEADLGPADLGVDLGPTDLGATDVPSDTPAADTGVDAAVDAPAADTGVDASADVADVDTGVDAAVDVPAADTGVDAAPDVPASDGSFTLDAPVATGDAACTPPTDVPPLPAVTPWTGASAAVAPPRQIAPISVTRVTSQRPTLRWVLPAGATGARVEVCADRPCTHVLVRLDATGTSVRLPAALPPGVAYWRLYGRTATGVGSTASPTWEFVVRHRDSPVDSSYGAIRDFNGDGYDDLVVGDPYDDGPLVYYGSACGVRTTGQRLTSLGIVDFGLAIGMAGDVNGDGLADLVVGAADDGVYPRPGAAFLFMGNRAGLSSTPEVRFRPALASGANHYLGAAVQGVHDVNGDGYEDVAVSDVALHIFVYLGGPAGVVPTSPLIIPITDAWTPYGDVIVGVGDVNGDGYADILTRSARTDTYAGRLLLYLGMAGGIQTTSPIIFESPGHYPSSDEFGFTMIDLGDEDLDGYADFAATGGGIVYIYRGGATPATTPAYEINGRAMSTGSNARSLFGSALGAGDSDNDGHSEILIGSAGVSTAYLYRLGAGAPAMVPGAVWHGPPMALLGGGGSVFGDSDGDGFDDLAIGETDDSIVYIVRGGPLGYSLGAPLLIVRTGVSATFGRTIARRLEPHQVRWASNG